MMEISAKRDHPLATSHCNFVCYTYIETTPQIPGLQAFFHTLTVREVKPFLMQVLRIMRMPDCGTAASGIDLRKCDASHRHRPVMLCMLQLLG